MVPKSRIYSLSPRVIHKFSPYYGYIHTLCQPRKSNRRFFGFFRQHESLSIKTRGPAGKKQNCSRKNNKNESLLSLQKLRLTSTIKVVRNICCFVSVMSSRYSSYSSRYGGSRDYGSGSSSYSRDRDGSFRDRDSSYTSSRYSSRPKYTSYASKYSTDLGKSTDSKE